jgi:hypothetical protein
MLIEYTIDQQDQTYGPLVAFQIHSKVFKILHSGIPKEFTQAIVSPIPEFETRYAMLFASPNAFLLTFPVLL